MHLTTPKFGEYDQVIEFLLPYPMVIVDPADWPPLKCRIGDRPVRIHKPIPSNKTYEPDGRFGNETLEAFCSIVRVFSAPHANADRPKPEEVWPLVVSLLEWTRIKARHFWLLHGSTGFDVLFKASVITRNPDGSYSHNANAGAFRRSVLVRPLSKELWSAVGTDLMKGHAPPISESVFCDALLSIANGDECKALLELGVACEIEISQLLDDAARHPPQLPSKSDYLKKEASGEWFHFADKLEGCTRAFELLKPGEFSGNHIPPDWVDTVKRLYRLRGKIAHSGKLLGNTVRVEACVIAANALFKYSRAVRERAGLETYYMPGSAPCQEQLAGILGH